MTLPPRVPDPDTPEDPGIDTPQEIPPEGPPGQEPDWRSPGGDEPPMRAPEEQPDVETELGHVPRDPT